LNLLRQYGWRTRDHSVIRGINSRLDEMQAAVLRVKLRHLDTWNTRRRALADAYDRALPDSITKPPRPAGREPVYHLYVIESPQRDALRAHLKAAGIETLVHYPVPAHKQEAYADMGWGAFPVSERLAETIVSLPLYPEMDEGVVAQVAETIAALGQ
jgi:dTDP-4-amino-4,6-dideoxygalactose transaminase